MHNCILGFALRGVCRPFVALCNGLLSLGIGQRVAMGALARSTASSVHARMSHDLGIGKIGRTDWPAAH